MSEESPNKKIIKLMRLTSQEQMILTYMEQFYKEPRNSQKLFKLLNGRTSIRLVDYFTTNYSKKFRSNIMLTTNKKIQNVESSQVLKDDRNIEDITSIDVKSKNQNYQIFNIHSSYKSQLKAWNKKYFDPFSRGDRIVFFLNDVCIITTIGQLNFFKWFINNKIYKYIKEHYDDIEQNMNSNKQSTRTNKKPSSNKSYYKKNQIKNSYLSSQSSIRKIDNITLNSTKPNSNSLTSNNKFKKSAKIEVRFD